MALAGAGWRTAAAAAAASEEVPQGQHAAGEVLCENRPPSRPASKAEEKRPASVAAPGQEQEAPAVEAEEAAPLVLLAVAAATGGSESTIDMDLLAEPQELAPAAEPSHSDSGEW